MALLATLLLPALAALALCGHTGYAWATLLLPESLRPQRLTLMPIIGLALLLVITAALTTTTALTPPVIVAGLAVAVVPLNVWVLTRLSTIYDLRFTIGNIANRHTWFSILNSQFSIAFLSCLLFILAVLPAARSGTVAPLGRNWDAADFYVPLGRMLQLVSQRDLAELPRNPLVAVVTEPPVSGRIHAFSYLHAAVSSATGIEPLYTFVPLMAFLLALCPAAVFALGRAANLSPRASLLMMALVALAWLPLWVTYNSFANHLLALPLLWFGLAAGIIALREGGRAAIATGALGAAALATGYYPAMSAYVVLLLPVAVWLGVRSQEFAFVGRRSSVVGRLCVLGAFAFVLSLPAQYYFFIKEGFFDEALRSGIGYRIDRYVSTAEALGFAAKLRGEGVAWFAWLTALGVACALLLGGLALVRQRAPLLAAMLCGALVYQALMVWRGYYYGFYKGVTFELPVFAGLIATGIYDLRLTIDDWLHRRIWSRHRVIVSSCHLVIVSIIIGLNVATLGRVQSNYSATGPRLWNAEELAVAPLRASMPRDASVLVVPSDERSPTFNSLVSYALLGNRMYGKFSTAYGTLANRPKEHIPDGALLPDRADPASYGYRAEDVRWMGAGMRLYRKPDGLRYHRALGEGGRAPEIVPGESLTLRLGANGLVLPKERKPDQTPGTAQFTLAAASFGETSLVIGENVHILPGGLIELSLPPLALPATLELRNTGTKPVYLWWAELRDPAPNYGAQPREAVFVQMLPDASDHGRTSADIRLHTLALPNHTQKLTGLLTIVNRDQRVGEWVFFPDAGDYRLHADLRQLTVALTKAGQSVDLSGFGQATGDGDYAATVALANNGTVIYNATLWRWRVENGEIGEVETDAVLFDVLALPRAATPLEATTSDGTLRLRGYTMPNHNPQFREILPLDLVWQSLEPISGDLQARVMLRDNTGHVIAEQTQTLGVENHGTSTWQVGELASTTFTLALPRTTSGHVALTIEVLSADGQPLRFANGTTAFRSEIVVDQ